MLNGKEKQGSDIMDDLLFDCFDVRSLQNLFHYVSITRKKFHAKYMIQLPMENKNEEACISSHGLGVLSRKFGTICT